MRNPTHRVLAGAPATALALLLLGCLGGNGAAEAAAQARGAADPESHCVEAERFLVEDRGMRAISDPDTIDDWRTQQMVPGCRVTAAGITTRTMEEESERFYGALRAAGWERTPDPRDAPGESSLRFRLGETDCLFNLYSDLLLFTEAEIEVSTAMAPGAGEDRYHILALCKPAMEAAPRQGDR